MRHSRLKIRIGQDQEEVDQDFAWQDQEEGFAWQDQEEVDQDFAKKKDQEEVDRWIKSGRSRRSG